LIRIALLTCTAYVKGTVNDPTPFPEPNAAHGSNHWAFERGLSVALIPLVAAGFAKHGSSAILDGALALTLVVHSHIGFDCILADYLHKRKFPIAGPLSTWTLRAATLATLYGLYEFNTSKYRSPDFLPFAQYADRTPRLILRADDVGLTELIAKVWTA
jgi:succinate dehydrogenase (ubiquinone) membrane anchor subunit